MLGVNLLVCVVLGEVGSNWLGVCNCIVFFRWCLNYWVWFLFFVGKIE